MAKYGTKEQTLSISIQVKLTPRPQVITSEELIRYTEEIIKEPEQKQEFLQEQTKLRNEQLATDPENIIEETAEFRIWGWGEAEKVREDCIISRPTVGPGGPTRQLDRTQFRAMMLRRLLTKWSVEVVDAEGTDVPLEVIPVPEHPGATQLSDRYYSLITGLSDLAPVIDGFLAELDRKLSGEDEGSGEVLSASA